MDNERKPGNRTEAKSDKRRLNKAKTTLSSSFFVLARFIDTSNGIPPLFLRWNKDSNDSQSIKKGSEGEIPLLQGNVGFFKTKEEFLKAAQRFCKYDPDKDKGKFKLNPDNYSYIAIVTNKEFENQLAFCGRHSDSDEFIIDIHPEITLLTDIIKERMKQVDEKIQQNMALFTALSEKLNFLDNTQQMPEC